MVDSMLELVSDATVHHIGMYRSKSLLPVQYYNRLPKVCDVDVAYVLDPLIATSNTIISVVGILKKVSPFSLQQYHEYIPWEKMCLGMLFVYFEKRNATT